QTVHAGDVRSGSRKCGLILLAGVAIATPALTPPYLTGGNKSTGNSQKNIRKSFSYEGVTKFQRMSNGLYKLPYYFVNGGMFTESTKLVTAFKRKTLGLWTISKPFSCCDWYYKAVSKRY